MPTPFQHLIYAEQVSHHPALPARIRDVLAAAPGPYLLGNVAPDVRTLTGRSRSETHFYRLDQPREPTAAERLLTAYPELSDPRRLDTAQAAFLSGYLVHLAWDEIWAWDLFLPFFRDRSGWPDRLAYHLHHNALRALLDRQAYAALRSSGEAATLLWRTTPGPWLPFVGVEVLAAWRDLIGEQLDDPAMVRTMAFFAERMRVPVRQVAEIVAAMDAGTYAAIPGLEAALARYERRGLTFALQSLLRYWRIEARLPYGAPDAEAQSTVEG